MVELQLRSTIGLFSALLFGAAIGFAGCGDDGGGGGGTGGKAGDAAVGTGGRATGGAGGGSGGATVAPDAGRDVAATGGAGGIGGAGGTSAGDAAPDVPIGTGGIDGGPIDVAPIDVGIDMSGIDGPVAATLHLYVGCADSTGTIQMYGLDGASGALAPLSNFTVGGAISNTEFNATEDRMYIAHVISGESMVSTYTRNPTTGALTLRGAPVAVPYTPPAAAVDGGVAIDGGAGGIDAGPPPTNAGPQTLTLDRSRKFVAVPNYFSGYVYVYDIASDESIRSLVAWDSAGNNAHHAVFTLNNKFMLVPYLGSNLIEVYGFDATTGAITAAGSTTLPNADSGPRHIALHSNGTWLYSINETAGGASSAAGSIDLFTVDQTAGTVTSVATYAVPLPTGYTGAKNGSEIEILPGEKVLIVSMRLDNAAEGSLVSYSINATTGALTLIDQQGSHGKTPRQFSLTKDGTLLVLGNQNSNTIAVFKVDPTAGSMSFVGDQAVCTSPRFARMATIK
jgi:6-phosphogluconolactonase (cycloisomerase 2 family)